MIAAGLIAAGVYAAQKAAQPVAQKPDKNTHDHELSYPSGGARPDPLARRPYSGNNAISLPPRKEQHPSLERGVYARQPISPALDQKRRKMLTAALPSAPPFHPGNFITRGQMESAKYGWYPGGRGSNYRLLPAQKVHPAIREMGPPPAYD